MREALGVATLPTLSALRTIIRNAWGAARAQIRVDAARTWPRPGDRWRGRSWDVVVIGLERPATMAQFGVAYSVDGTRLWVPLDQWPAVVSSMHLVYRRERAP